MRTYNIEARDLPDLWFQALYNILEKGREYIIDKGSYSGQTRLEYDFFKGHIKYPGTRPLLPDIPSNYGIPNPVEENYIYGGKNCPRSYLEYLMTSNKEPKESYTYGERLTEVPLSNKEFERFKTKNKKIKINNLIISKKKGKIYLNQIEWICECYRCFGHHNNQLILQIANTSDIYLSDPPCLRHIDTKIQNNKLNFFAYFRSWDLWGGMPANLAGIQILKEYMANQIGVDDGELIVESKGLHIYGYAKKLAKIRCSKN